MKPLIAGAIALLAFAAPAAAQQTTRGSTLQNAPNVNFGCEVAPGTALGFPEAVMQPHGFPSCSWWMSGSAGTVGDPRTHAVPSTGTVTKVRVRSGNNPAPIRVVINRSLNGLCCGAVQVSNVLQPTPNAVSEFTVNLPVESSRAPDPVKPTEALSTLDYVGISAASGAGTLPIFDQGAGTHTPEASFNPNVLLSMMTAPELLPTDGTRVTGRAAPGWELLMQFDHVPCPTNQFGQPARSAGARAAQAGCPQRAAAPPSSTPAPQGPPAAQTPAPAVTPAAPGARFLGSSTLRARRGRLAFPLTCTAAGGCRGTLRVLNGRRLLASARVNVASGRATLRPKLTKAGRSALRRGKRVRAVAQLNLGAAGVVSRNVTLRG